MDHRFGAQNRPAFFSNGAADLRSLADWQPNWVTTPLEIEAEIDLLREGIKTIEQWKSIDPNPTKIELIHGNFLPPGADSLADDPTLPSLGHPLPEAYSKIGLNLDDFAIVYSYPWPGEDDFHELVFDRYAESGALLVQFCGPNDVRVCRKANSPMTR